MKSFRRIFRAVVLTLLLLAVVVPAALYMVLATPWAQNYGRRLANEELSALLGVEVRVDRLTYHPFNTLSLYGIHIDDAAGHPALEALSLSARFELWHFVRTGRLVVDYVVVESPSVSLSRTAPGAPLNIQPILDRLKSDDPNKPPTAFDLKISTAIIRNGRFRYDITSAARRSAGIDPAHIEVTDLYLYAYPRHITADTYDIAIESLSLRERGGLVLSDFSADATASPERIDLHSLTVRMPGSYISLRPATLPIDGYASIGRTLRHTPLHIATESPAHIATADLAWALPQLADIDRVAELDIDAEASLSEATLHGLSLSDNHGLSLSLTGEARGIDNRDSLRFELDALQINAPATELATVIRPFSAQAAMYASRCGNVSLKTTARGSLADITARARLAAAEGIIDFDGRVTRDAQRGRYSAEGGATVTGLNVGRVLADPRLGRVTATIDGNADFGGRLNTEADAELHIADATFDSYTYSDVTLSASLHDRTLVADLGSNDPNATLRLNIEGSDKDGDTHLAIDCDIDRLAPHTLKLSGAYPTYALRGKLKADAHGSNADNATGRVEVSDLSFVPDSSDAGSPLNIRRLIAELTRSGGHALLQIDSDVLHGKAEGTVSPSTLAATLRDMASHTLPALLAHDDRLHERISRGEGANNFDFSFTIADAEELSKFLKLPVTVIYPISIDGQVSSSTGKAYALVDAPYLQQGDKIIEATVVQASLDTSSDRADVYATTRMPTKKGPMTAVVDVSGADNRFDTTIDWVIDRKIPLNGRINFSTLLGRGDDGRLSADTRFNPGEITFGDDVWAIAPSSLIWADGSLRAEDFSLTSDTQSIRINGTAGPSVEQTVTVDLRDIQLESIFETLEINNALISGRATGTFTAAAALSRTPLLMTDDLHVRDIGYNYCTLGNAVVNAHYDTDRQSFYLDADIVNPEGLHSRIYGDIFAATESLDLYFDARHIKVGFMKPFMEAFASDVEGYASGTAHLFGTFKDIDMEADIYARDLRLKIDFTNTWYSATDSIHVRPGIINLEDITIRDVEGHTALLNGWLRHDYFHNPVFDFRISEARDFLSYDVTPALSPDWYGTVYGNGSARVQGRPGVVEIGVNMTTAPRSTFTFVLSDRLEAEQYSFITFRDRTEVQVTDTLMVVRDDIPEVVKEFRRRILAQNADTPSAYLMDIQVDITPQAQMIIVMDPVGGDRIRANGAGNLRLTYSSPENDLRMYGTYTLEQGKYNFTLQDIIIKDFTIDPGSSITFRGDPYSAQLDIDAVYSVNANLSDLDESFLQDKDLNRTNVPVQALLKVTGDMRQPDINFDLRFPTLTSDIYRKVRSIISTEEMMNRQIIYLLALNRFYTPDYMTATRGNELFSVASSTISSQLSGMLGKLSDHWSIAPNLRSDRGDFSDVEVDVALSSRLLNNRLLFNGNFGYRDRSLNNNQFIGDFDIEYLLTPRGTWRLKAYNRYNDQNYYVRTAQTTQGVGIMFRRDFDTLFPRRHKKKDNAPADTSATTLSDSVHPGVRFRTLSAPNCPISDTDNTTH